MCQTGASMRLIWRSCWPTRARRYPSAPTPAAPVPEAEADNDENVGILDLLALLANWGTCPALCPPSFTGDLNGDCVVNPYVVAALVTNWGACPP